MKCPFPVLADIHNSEIYRFYLFNLYVASKLHHHVLQKGKRNFLTIKTLDKVKD